MENYILKTLSFVFFMFGIYFLITARIEDAKKDIKLILTKNHAEYMRIETEKQKTIAEFLRSVKTGG